MTSEADRIAAITAFLSQHQNCPAKKLAPHSRLEEDLGITGDDAAEFIEAFAKRFAVDLSGIDFHRHFGPEGFNPLWLFWQPRWLRELGRHPVTLTHLAAVAQAGRWFEPPERPAAKR